MLKPVADWRRQVAEVLPAPRVLILDAPIRLPGIAMDRRAARRMLDGGPARATSRGEGWYHALVAVELTGAGPAQRPGEREVSAAFKGHVVRVDLAAPGGRVFASFGGAALASVAAAPSTRVGRVLAEIRARRDRCAALTGAAEKIDCTERLCAFVGKQRGMVETARACRDKVREARAAVASRSGKTSRPERNCRTRFADRAAKPWLPRAASRATRDAIAECAARKARRAYGPDIVGLRLGMAPTAARAILAERTGAESLESLGDARPFDRAELAIGNYGTRGLVAFWLATSSGMRLAGVSRRLYFGRDRPDADSLEKVLRDKYGKPDWSDGKRVHVWHPAARRADSDLCGELADFVQPRDGWSAPWPGRSSHGAEPRLPMMIGPPVGRGTIVGIANADRW